MATVTVLVSRHPDAEDDFTISAPEGTDVQIIYADWGSGFDGEPSTVEEGEYAVEMADNLTEQASNLPDGDPVKEAVHGIADELLDAAEELGVDIDAVREDVRETEARLKAMQA
jgi:hypothetical protein